jgi:hypothetical protein
MKLKLDSNFCDLLFAFRACGVSYLIVGGWAVYQALMRFGAPLKDMDKNQFLQPGTFFRIGAPPCQVDIFREIPGVHFEACWPRRLEILLDAENVLTANFISAEDLVAAKVASGREQDVADAQAIRRAQQRKPKT